MADRKAQQAELQALHADLARQEMSNQLSAALKQLIEEGASANQIETNLSVLKRQLEKQFGVPFSMANGGPVTRGLGSLNEVARNMTRGPRGIGAYQQFARNMFR